MVAPARGAPVCAVKMRPDKVTFVSVFLEEDCASAECNIIPGKMKTANKIIFIVVF